MTWKKKFDRFYSNPILVLSLITAVPLQIYFAKFDLVQLWTTKERKIEENCGPLKESCRFVEKKLSILAQNDMVRKVNVSYKWESLL